MKPSSRLRTFALACVLSLTPTLAGCATIRTLIYGTEAEPRPSSVPCEALTYWRPSRQDSDDTIRQATENNAVLDHFCGPQP